MKILLRIWDLFLYDGSIVLFQITLGMLKMKVSHRILNLSIDVSSRDHFSDFVFQEPKLKGLENSAQIFNALSDIPGDIDDIDELLEVSQDLASSLGDILIDTHRRKHLAYLMADQGALVNPESSRNLPKQVQLTFDIPNDSFYLTFVNIVLAPTQIKILVEQFCSSQKGFRWHHKLKVLNRSNWYDY